MIVENNSHTPPNGDANSRTVAIQGHPESTKGTNVSSSSSTGITESTCFDLYHLLLSLKASVQIDLTKDSIYHDNEHNIESCSIYFQSDYNIQCIRDVSACLLSITEHSENNEYNTELVEDPELWNSIAVSCEYLLAILQRRETSIPNNADNDKEVVAAHSKIDGNDNVDERNRFDEIATMLKQISIIAHNTAHSQYTKIKEWLVPDLPKPQDMLSYLTPPVPNNDRTISSSTYNTSIQNSTKTYQSSDSMDEHCRMLYHQHEQIVQTFTYTERQLKVQTTPINLIKPCYDETEVLVFENTICIENENELNTFALTINENNCTEISIDVQNHMYRSFSGFICLIQITVRISTDNDNNDDVHNKNDSKNTKGRCQIYLIDTLAIERQTLIKVLTPIFTNPRIVKIIHGAHNAVLWLQRDFGVGIVNLFDTKQAIIALSSSQSSSTSMPFPLSSFHSVVKRYCKNIILSKSYVLSDWRQRPLPEFMKRYASQTTYHLLEIYDRVKVDLVEMGGINMIRNVFDACRPICMVRYSPTLFDPLGYKILIRTALDKEKGNDSPAKERILLRELWDWRDRIARKFDESIQYICTDTDLQSIAKTSPTTEHELRALLAPTVPLLAVDEYSQDVLRCVVQTLERLHHRQDVSTDRKVKSGNKEKGFHHLSTIDTSHGNEVEWCTGDFTLQPEHPVGLAPSSAFFKPAVDRRDKDFNRTRGIMSPVLGTEALYEQAGWLTPQEQNPDYHQRRNMNVDKQYETQRGRDGNDEALGVNHFDTAKDVAKVKQSGQPLASVINRKGDNDMESHFSTTKNNGKDRLDVDCSNNVESGSSHITSQQLVDRDGKNECIPVISGSLSSISVSANDRKGAPLDNDDETDSGAIDNADDVNTGSEDESNWEFYAIPNSIRDIYRISNRNRSIKNAVSPTLERGDAAASTDREMDELIKAEAILRERGLTADKTYAYLFDDNSDGFPTSSERESEESVPDASSNVTTREDDLAFMKEVGWIQCEKELDFFMHLQLGNEQETGGDSKSLNDGQTKELSRPNQVGRCRSSSIEYPSDNNTKTVSRSSGTSSSFQLSHSGSCTSPLSLRELQRC